MRSSNQIEKMISQDNTKSIFALILIENVFGKDHLHYLFCYTRMCTVYQRFIYSNVNVIRVYRWFGKVTDAIPFQCCAIYLNLSWYVQWNKVISKAKSCYFDYSQEITLCLSFLTIISR